MIESEKREWTINALESLVRNLKQGCSNHGCVVTGPKKGMGTNASCQCGPYRTAKHLHWIAREFESLGHSWPPTPPKNPQLTEL